MAFKLYNAPQSTCSQRVRFVLNAKHLPFDEVKLNLLDGDQLKPDYLKLNPNGVVPTLDHDGAIVTDSTVITEYLDEVVPENSFTPENPVTRARMRALMHFMDEMPAASVRVPTFNLAFLPKFQAMSREDFVAMAMSKPLRKEFMLAMGQTGFPKAEMDAALGYPLLDVTASGLNQAAYNFLTNRRNRHRIETPLRANNFGTIVVEWERQEPRVTIELREEDGAAPLLYRLPLARLRKDAGPALAPQKD